MSQNRQTCVCVCVKLKLITQTKSFDLMTTLSGNQVSDGRPIGKVPTCATKNKIMNLDMEQAKPDKP